MKPPAEPSPEDLRGLVQLARRELLRSAAGSDEEVKREQLIRAQRRVLVRRRSSRWAAAALAVAAVFALLLHSPHPAAESLLAYTVSQSNAAAEPTATTHYAFGDGTTIALGHDSELAVVSADARAPRVQLWRGDARVKVIHRPNAHWKFAAGPFEVAVVGTAFDLHWDPQHRDFGLNLREGIVQITGPVLDGPLLLRAGHTISVSLETGRVDITSAAAPLAEASRPTSTAPGGEPRSAGGSPPAPSATPGAAPAAAESWRVLVGRGRFAQVVSSAQALPLDSCLATCSASDLRALGDAARYSGHAALAERAFLALRSRFPGTSDSTVAAFLLGRTCEAERKREPARAWYERYLTEAPSGQFVLEAQAGRARVGTP